MKNLTEVAILNKQEVELDMNATMHEIEYWFSLGYDIVFRETDGSTCACHDCVQFKVNMH